MRSTQVLACFAVVVAFVPQARSEPRPQDRPVTQADLDRLEQKLEAQQRMLDKLLQLNEQYLRQLVGLLSEARPPAAGAPSSGEGKPARDEPKPADPRVAAVKPKLAPRPTGAITGKVTGGGGEAVVYVEDIIATSRGVATMNQEGKQFKPRVVVAPKGTRVDFPNRDAIFHNVFSVTPDNSFDLGSFPQGASKSVTMTRPGVVTVYCNMHSQMIGYILITPSALYAQTGEDGSFRLPNVPVGHHRVVAWAPNAKPTISEVEVSEAEPATLELAVKRGHVGPHTNKDGMAYGSYND